MVLFRVVLKTHPTFLANGYFFKKVNPKNVHMAETINNIAQGPQQGNLCLAFPLGNLGPKAASSDMLMAVFFEHRLM